MSESTARLIPALLSRSDVSFDRLCLLSRWVSASVSSES